MRSHVTKAPIALAADNSRHHAIFKVVKCFEMLHTKLCGVGAVVLAYLGLSKTISVIGDFFWLCQNYQTSCETSNVTDPWRQLYATVGIKFPSGLAAVCN